MRRPSTSPGAVGRLAVALAAALIVVPGTPPAPAAAVGPLPDCALDDVRTDPRGYGDWATTQVDWNLTLGPRYEPPDLVSVNEGGVAGGGYIRRVVIDDLRAMARAAEDNGTPLVAWSPFRGYRQQVALFNGYAGWTGTRYTNFDNAIKFSARPGHSEHQLGLTIDFVAVGDTGLTSNWEVTPTGAWMAQNAWKYGWLMSYPKGKKRLTCYTYEPWHYRYVGRDLAAKIHDSGLTTREYLWANYTQVDGACMAAVPATLETPGRPRRCPLAAPGPTPVESEPPSSAEPHPTAAPGSPSPSATSANPAPNETREPAPVDPIGFLASGSVPIVATVVLGLGLLVLLLRRRSGVRR